MPTSAGPTKCRARFLLLCSPVWADGQLGVGRVDAALDSCAAAQYRNRDTSPSGPLAHPLPLLGHHHHHRQSWEMTPQDGALPLPTVGDSCRSHPCWSLLAGQRHGQKEEGGGGAACPCPVSRPCCPWAHPSCPPAPSWDQAAPSPVMHRPTAYKN